MITLSNAKPSSITGISEPKAMRSFTLGLPPKPVSTCFASTQPPEAPDQPCASAGACPPGPALIVLSLYQLSGSPRFPTLCQVPPPSMEDCKTAPSKLNSVFHQIFISTIGIAIALRLKQGLSTKDCSAEL